ncbi:MAG: helix-turn-helix domain-containing protein [Solirubrobacteraceae bacterium]
MPPKRQRKPRGPAHATLGEVVEQVIAEHGMSQSMFAQRAGMDVRQVNALVCGQANPNYDSLHLLCDALDIPLSELMRRVEALTFAGEAIGAKLNQRRGPDDDAPDVWGRRRDEGRRA